MTKSKVADRQWWSRNILMDHEVLQPDMTNGVLSIDSQKTCTSYDRRCRNAPQCQLRPSDEGIVYSSERTSAVSPPVVSLQE